MRPERWLVLAGLVLFGLSLALPAVVGEAFPARRGFDLLRQGAGLWRDGVYAWYANPATVLALALSWWGLYRLGLGVGLLGALLALSTFSAPSALENAGRSVPEFGFGPGFYLWLGAIVCALAAAGLGLSCPNRGP